MKWKEFNFAEFLIHQKKFGAPVANALLRDNFIKIFKQQQKQQQEQQIYTNNNNNNINNNNNLNYIHNNNNNTTVTNVPQPQSQQTAPIIYPAMGVGVSVVGVATYAGANQMREQMAVRRSLAARLQQHQMPMQGVVMVGV